MSDCSIDPPAVYYKTHSCVLVGSNAQMEALKALETTREQRDEEVANGENPTTTRNQNGDDTLRGAMNEDEGEDVERGIASYSGDRTNDAPDNLLGDSNATDDELGNDATEAQGVVDEPVSSRKRDQETMSSMVLEIKEDEGECKEMTRKSITALNCIFSVFCGFVAGILVLPVVIIPLWRLTKRLICSHPSDSSGQSHATTSQQPQRQGSRIRSCLEVFGSIIGVLATIATIVTTCVTLIPENPGVEVFHNVTQLHARPDNSEPVYFNALVRRADNQERIKGLGRDCFLLNGIHDDSFTVSVFEPTDAFYKFNMIPTIGKNWGLNENHPGFFEVTTDVGTQSFFFDFIVNAKNETSPPTEAPNPDPSPMEPTFGSGPPRNCSDSPCFPGVACDDDPDGGFSCGTCPLGHEGNGEFCERCPPDYEGDGVSCKRFRERFGQPMSTESGTDNPRRIWAQPSPAELNNMLAFCIENGYNHVEDFQEECIEDMDNDYLDWNATEGTWHVRQMESKAACYQLFSSITCLDFAPPRCSRNPCFPGVNCSDVPQGGFECGACPSEDFEGDGIDCVRFREEFEYPSATSSNSLPLRIWADSNETILLNRDGFCLFEKGYNDVEGFNISCDGKAGSNYLDWDPHDSVWKTHRINVTNEMHNSCYDLFQSITCFNDGDSIAGTDGVAGATPGMGIILGPVLGGLLFILVLALVIHRICRQHLDSLLEDDSKKVTDVAQDTI